MTSQTDKLGAKLHELDVRGREGNAAMAQTLDMHAAPARRAGDRARAELVHRGQALREAADGAVAKRKA